MKKDKVIESLENQANETTKQSRVKQNFRPIFFERAGIIAESDKIIASSIRNAIIQLLCERLSDANVDMITILAEILPEDCVNFSSIKEKYSVIRDGDFINCSINNLFLNLDKMSRLNKLNIFVYSSDIESFDVSKSSTIIEMMDSDYLSSLLHIYSNLKYNF